MNNRRKLMLSLAATALGRAPFARAQKTARVPRIGVLWHAGSADEERIPLAALVNGFKDRGYIAGQNIVFEHRFPNERPERFISLAAELVELKVDVVVAVTPQAALAAQKATQTIPIVFMVVPDPVGSKLVDSLARPGRNVTGMTNMALELVPKRVELLKELIPGLTRIALLVNGNYPDAARRYSEAGQAAAQPLGVTLQPVEVRAATDFDHAFAAMVQSKMQAACLTVDGLFYAEQAALARLARERKLPLIGFTRDMVETSGMLISYGPSSVASFRRTAYFVDRILSGTRPADLPVEQPTIIELVINAQTAKSFGIKVPQSILVRADKFNA